MADTTHHHIPADAAVFLPASIERSVWEYFSDRAVAIDIEAFLFEGLDFAAETPLIV